MKKCLFKSLSRWRIGDYIRQFSIVSGGVLLTLWLTTRITDAARQKEVRQAMQLVTLELKRNVQMIESYEAIYNEEARIARLIVEKGYSSTALPPDTETYYAQKITSGLARPYLFSTDALEMLKTSGLAAHIADKRQVIELLRCYNLLESFDAVLALYYDLRKEVLLAYDKKHPQQSVLNSPQAIIRSFDRTIADQSVRHWIYSIPRSFDRMFFHVHKQQCDQTIALLETRYGKVK